jgi:hypothetical protein
MARGRELDADLVLAARLQAELDEARARALLPDFPASDRPLGSALARRRLEDLSSLILLDPGVEDSRRRGHSALYDGEIETFGDQLVPSSHQQLLGSRARGEDDQAGSVPVDAVDDGGPPLWIVSPNLLGRYVEKAPRPGALGRDDGEACVLVVGEDSLVLVDQAGAGASRSRPLSLPSLPSRDSFL